jgi:hypothetical protein
MSDVLYVTPAQVLAAKLAFKLSQEDGEAPDEALKAIANAPAVAPQQLAPTYRTSADEHAVSEVIARLQRIEDQLQVHNPQASEQERSQPSAQHAPHPDDPPPWYQDVEGVTPPEQPAPTDVNRPDADEPVAGGFVDPMMSDEEVERTIREYQQRQRERPQDPDIEGPARGPGGPWSGGI